MQTLAESDQTKLRSSQILTSLHQIVSELIQNSLDADASHIDVGVDPAQWTCWVRDDGKGITRQGMMMIGKGLKGRYSKSAFALEGRLSEDIDSAVHVLQTLGTSKTYTPSSLAETGTFGFRGEALASVADLCCLELSSRDVLAPESWSVIAKGGEQIYYGPAVRWRREKPGTVVCVRDAFYNLPIRRLSHPNTQRTVDLVRREIERYALIAPHVTFTLEKAIKERDGSTSQSRIMTIPKSSSALAAFHNIYGRALAEHVDEVNVMAGSLKIEGFISLQGAPSKAFQFLYVNRYPLEYSDLHRTIESRFASTSFSKPNESAAGFDGDPTDQHSSTRKLECRPVYCLNLHVPRDHVDVCLEPNKRTVQFQDRHAIEDLVLRAVETFLERNGFRALASSSSVRIRGNDEISSHSSRKRIKPEIGCDKGKSAPSLPAGRRASRPSVEISASPADSEMQPMVWKDPTTGEIFIVDPRTGNSISASSTEAHNLPTDARDFRRQSIVDRRWLKLNDELTCQSSVFQASEASLPLISAGTWEETRDPHGSTSPLDGIKHRFTRQDLRGLKVLCQVDRKFIACIVKLDHQRDTLVLIDQHAADERVRVERFLRAFSTQFLDDSSNSDGVQRCALAEPTPVLLTSTETRRVADHSDLMQLMARWGFAVSLQDASGDALVELPRAPDNQGQLVVHTVPELLLSKLSKGNELRNVVRSFITMLDDHFHFQSGSPDHLGSHDETHPAGWLRAIKWCPPYILELIDSMACRGKSTITLIPQQGAIMFNDYLSLEQCRSLVTQLSETVFPFQCAHGRPSMVPLTSLSRTAPTRHAQHAIQWDKLSAFKDAS